MHLLLLAATVSSAPCVSHLHNVQQKITADADGTKTLHTEDGQTAGGFEQVLMAIGRAPETSKLGLDVSSQGK